MLELINRLPVFWQGVAASVIGGLILSALYFFVRIISSSVREWISNRREYIAVLRQQLSSANPSVRGEATIRILFGVAQWLVIAALLFILASLAQSPNKLFFEAGLKIGSLLCIVVSLWWLFQYQRPGISVQEDWREVLISRSWILVFNPPNRYKPITFLDDGTIGEGRNRNESSWRIVNGKLEILQDDGRVHSRFSYYARNSSFIHTNDTDTLSIKNQYIISSENG